MRDFEIDKDFERSLSKVQRRLVRLYYGEDASPARIESELGLSPEQAMDILREIGDVEHRVEWRPHEGAGPRTVIHRKEGQEPE